MPKDQRVTYRRRHGYNTASNQIKIVKTPGGRNVVQYVSKVVGRPKCGDCKAPLSGIPTLRPAEASRTSKHERTVSRAYGGSRCHTCVRERILRAFLIEEQKIVKQVLLEKMRKGKN